MGRIPMESMGPLTQITKSNKQQVPIVTCCVLLVCVAERERYTLCGVTLTKLGFNTQILISDTHTLKQKAYNVRLLDGKQLLLCSCIRRHRALHQLKP